MYSYNKQRGASAKSEQVMKEHDFLLPSDDSKSNIMSLDSMKHERDKSAEEKRDDAIIDRWMDRTR